MNRMTKAMARLGTLAVIATSALAAPFAIGTANAATITAVTTNGIVTANVVGAGPTFNAGPTPGTITITGISGGDSPTITVSGSAHFDTTVVPAGATLNVADNVMTCTVGPNCNTTLKIGDNNPAGEAIGITVVPSAVDIGVAVPMTFVAAPVLIAAPSANIVNGAVTTNLNASSSNGGTSPATFQVSGGTAGDTINIQLNSTHAYFTTVPASPGKVTATTATCVVPCPVMTVGDAYPETVSVSATDVTSAFDNPAGGFLAFNVNFNAIFFKTCGTTSGTTPPGIQNAALAGGNTCTSQVQAGGVATTQTVEYDYAGAPKLGQNLIASISLGNSVQFTASTGVTLVGPGNKQATCATAADGTCSFMLVDNNAADIGTSVTMTVEENGAPFGYNHAGGNTFCDIDSAAPPATCAAGVGQDPSTGAGNAAVELINVSSAPVPPGRVNLISAKLIAPGSQSAGSSKSAEPGDAIQLQYQLLGTCTPSSAFQNCDNTAGSGALSVADAGIPLALSVDHGFFTPNCTVSRSTQGNPITGTNNYDNCSFSTAPAANGVVGNLTSSGTTQNVTTDSGGYFTVTLGIGKDTAFDNNGFVVAHLTAATSGTTVSTFAPMQVGALPVGTSCPVGGESIQAQLPVGTSAILKGDGTVTPAQPGCQEDVAWTTRETPLNGAKATLATIKPLSSPNNVSINTENNYDATDSGTINVPDTGRVVFVVHATDQFGNLTNDAGDGNLWLSKSGPGQVWKCPFGGGSPVDACPQPPVLATSGVGTAQADLTTKQLDKAVIGSYTDLPAQQRYQADTFPYGAFGGNDGYTTTVPSVNDGTTTVVLSWAPNAQQFASFSGAVGPAAAVATYKTVAATTTSTDTYTLNFYNQLAQPVITFAVVPGNKVKTSTGVTVTATVLDQFKNPLVGVTVDALRSGANESSCVPIQNVANGGGAGNVLFTNTSGSAAYTFSCNMPGASTVTMIVEGYGQVGGSQISLARGTETVTFTGSGTHSTVERPTVSLTSFHKHHLTVNVHTSPSLGAGHTVNIYRLRNGIKHLVGQTHTGPRGNASLSFHGLRSGAHWRVAAKVVNIGTQYRSEFSQAVGHRVK
mgnify:CR=1 FL=1